MNNEFNPWAVILLIATAGVVCFCATWGLMFLFDAIGIFAD